MFGRWFCFALLVSSLSVFAAESNILVLSPDIQRGNLENPQGLWPLLGIGMGLMDHNSTARTGGVPAHVKVLGSYYFDQVPFVADVGLGLHNESLTQNGSGSDSIQSLYTEFAGRYILTNRWQLGAIWNTLVDNPRRYQSNTDTLATFVGAQALKEFSWKDEYLVRVGGRAMTSLGFNGGSVNTFMAELEVSFGSGGQAAPEPAPIVEQEIHPQPIAPHLDARAIQSYSLDPKLVHFNSNSTKLVKTSEGYIRKLAKALADNHGLFDRVQVVGHADQRGTNVYNDKLSRRRAHAITSVLIQAGVDPSQIVPIGMGKRDLLSDSMSAHSLLQNRRVELAFSGVKNYEALKNVIDSAVK